jgi:hypothetical protein
MARAAIRTRVVDLDLITRMRQLFGDIKNVQRNLGLERDLTYPIFYRAMNFGPVKAEEKALIEERWARWLEVFARPEIPVSQPLALTHELADELPSWHPDHAAEVA